MIVIKDEQVLREVLANYHPILVDIVCFVYAIENDIVVTSAFRKDDPGVHGFWRGIDLRSWIYIEPEKVVNAVNSKWKYDPNRPEMVCAMFHSVKGGAKHIHLQVHPNTVEV